MKKTYPIFVILCGLWSVHAMARSQSAAQDKHDAAENAPASAEGKVLAQYIGQWRWKTDETSDGAMKSRSGEQTSRWLIGGKVVEQRYKTGDGADDGVVMASYDSDRQSYFACYFSAEGKLTTWTGKWNPGVHQMNWEGHHAKGVVTMTERFIDPHTEEIKAVNKDNEGKTLSEWVERDTRRVGELGENREGLSAPKKTPEKPPTAEGKVLAQYLGEWNWKGDGTSDGVAKSRTGEEKTRWLLGGKVLETRYQSSAGVDEAFVMLAFDPDQKAYVGCTVLPDATVTTWTGQWAADAHQMTWEGRNAKSVVKMIDRFLDSDTVEVKGVVTDNEGKTVSEWVERDTRKHE